MEGQRGSYSVSGFSGDASGGNVRASAAGPRTGAARPCPGGIPVASARVGWMVRRTAVGVAAPASGCGHQCDVVDFVLMDSGRHCTDGARRSHGRVISVRNTSLRVHLRLPAYSAPPKSNRLIAFPLSVVRDQTIIREACSGCPWVPRLVGTAALLFSDDPFATAGRATAAPLRSVPGRRAGRSSD